MERNGYEAGGVDDVDFVEVSILLRGGRGRVEMEIELNDCWRASYAPYYVNLCNRMKEQSRSWSVDLNEVTGRAVICG